MTNKDITVLREYLASFLEERPAHEPDTDDAWVSEKGLWHYAQNPAYRETLSRLISLYPDAFYYPELSISYEEWSKLFEERMQNDREFRSLREGLKDTPSHLWLPVPLDEDWDALLNALFLLSEKIGRYFVLRQLDSGGYSAHYPPDRESRYVNADPRVALLEAACAAIDDLRGRQP